MSGIKNRTRLHLPPFRITNLGDDQHGINPIWATESHDWVRNPISGSNTSQYPIAFNTETLVGAGVRRPPLADLVSSRFPFHVPRTVVFDWTFFQSEFSVSSDLDTLVDLVGADKLDQLGVFLSTQLMSFAWLSAPVQAGVVWTGTTQVTDLPAGDPNNTAFMNGIIAQGQWVATTDPTQFIGGETLVIAGTPNDISSQQYWFTYVQTGGGRVHATQQMDQCAANIQAMIARSTKWRMVQYIPANWIGNTDSSLGFVYADLITDSAAFISAVADSNVVLKVLPVTNFSGYQQFDLNDIANEIKTFFGIH